MSNSISIREHLDLAKAAGVPLADYAKQNGIDPQKFYTLNSKLKSRERKRHPPVFRQVAIESVKSLKIVLPSGIAIEADEDSIDLAVAAAKKLV